MRTPFGRDWYSVKEMACMCPFNPVVQEAARGAHQCPGTTASLCMCVCTEYLPRYLGRQVGP